MSILVCIPTRDRPEYLSCLLSSLFFQTHQKFDVLIADTSEHEGELEEDPMFVRFRDALIGRGCLVDVRSVPVTGRSESTAVNYLMLKAYQCSHEYIYKVDDDHVLPPDALHRLECSYEGSSHDAPWIISGLTPWMHRIGEGLSGPGDSVRPASELVDTGEVSYISRSFDGSLEINIGHFNRYNADRLAPTELASAANFFMKPDIRLLWSDTGPSSLFADAVWFLQLREFLDYELFFDLGVHAWHVAAPSGGVREQLDCYAKGSRWDKQRVRHLDHVYSALKE